MWATKLEMELLYEIETVKNANEREFLWTPGAIEKMHFPVVIWTSLFDILQKTQLHNRKSHYFDGARRPQWSHLFSIINNKIHQKLISVYVFQRCSHFQNEILKWKKYTSQPNLKLSQKCNVSYKRQVWNWPWWISKLAQWWRIWATKNSDFIRCCLYIVAQKPIKIPNKLIKCI